MKPDAPCRSENGTDHVSIYFRSFGKSKLQWSLHDRFENGADRPMFQFTSGDLSESFRSDEHDTDGNGSLKATHRSIRVAQGHPFEWPTVVHLNTHEVFTGPGSKFNSTRLIQIEEHYIVAAGISKMHSPFRIPSYCTWVANKKAPREKLLYCMSLPSTAVVALMVTNSTFVLALCRTNVLCYSEEYEFACQYAIQCC